MLASLTNIAEIENCPSCWAPLIEYIGHRVVTVEPRDYDCEAIEWWQLFRNARDPRHMLEIACACRPELVDALFRVDTEWPCPLKQTQRVHGFLMTTHSSFHRPEIRDYMDKVSVCAPLHDRCLIVPCSADKPYPSALHRTLINLLSPGWELIVATTALGLVPYQLFKDMPQYDAGLPWRERLVDEVYTYFCLHRENYKGVVVYSDFCAGAIAEGLKLAGVEGNFVLGEHRRDNYENLTSRENLNSLSRYVADVDAALVPRFMHQDQESDSPDGR